MKKILQNVVKSDCLLTSVVFKSVKEVETL